MAELTVPRIDFSILGELPQVYQQSRADAVRRRTLANLGQGSQADADTLLKSGDLSLAQLGINLRNRQEDQARQAQLDARALKNDEFSHGIQSAQLELSRRAADRKDETPLDQVNRRVEVLKANGINPASPEGKTYALTGEFTDPNLPKVLSPGSSVVRPGSGEVIVDNATKASLDDDTADLLARRTLQGDTRALVGLGRGAQGAENLVKVQKRAAEIAKENGIEAPDILNNAAVQAGRMSESRTLGTKSANFGVAEKAMEESLPIALEASKNVSRTAFPVVNQLVLAGRTNVGDPAVKKFLIATDTAAKDYARTINPNGATRESDIAYARKILSTADGPEAYAAALQQLKTEAGVTKRAILRQKEEVQSRGRSETHNTSQGNGAETMLGHARDAIAQGAPREAVIERLKQAGVDPSGL